MLFHLARFPLQCCFDPWHKGIIERAPLLPTEGHFGIGQQTVSERLNNRFAPQINADNDQFLPADPHVRLQTAA